MEVDGMRCRLMEAGRSSCKLEWKQMEVGGCRWKFM